MKRLYRAYMPEKIYTPVKHFILTALEVFDRFAAGQGMESLILGTLCFLGMFVLRLEYSGLVSLIVGMTAFIPLLGAYIGGGTGVVLLLFISAKKALTFLIFFIILQQIENNIIYPRAVSYTHLDVYKRQTQVTHEGSDMSVYQVGKEIKEQFPVFESYDMTLEATVTKMMWALTQTADYDAFGTLFYQTVNHDILYV